LKSRRSVGRNRRALGACVSFGLPRTAAVRWLTASPDQKIIAGARTSGPQAGRLVVALPAAPQKTEAPSRTVQTTARALPI